MANRMSRGEFIALIAMMFATIAFSIDSMLPALKQAQRPDRVRIRRVFGGLERHLHMALRGQVVDLDRLALLNQTDQVGGIGEVAVVQEEAHVLLVRIAVEMVHPTGVEGGGAALDAVDDVALCEQELGEIGPVLARGPGYERDFVSHGQDRRAKSPESQPLMSERPGP